MYTNKVFKKGQKIYYLSTNFSTLNRGGDNEVNVCVVVERIVDSCGKKRLTFVDGGNDFVFGKQVSNQQRDGQSLGFYGYFETPGEAFNAFDENQKAFPNDKKVIVEKVYSDLTDDLFVDYRESKVSYKQSKWL